MPIHLETYFKRIGYVGKMDVSIETLKAIHTHQLFAIPFENLAIHDKKNEDNLEDFIHLDEEALFQKLVVNHRGGYCHENNELFALVLIKLGFQVERLAARVLLTPNIPIGHKLLLVTIEDEKWIADVGFGSYGLFEPIRLEMEKEVHQYSDKFRLIEENGEYVFQIFDKEHWKSNYAFTLKTFQPCDFESMSYHISHHPQSLFVKHRLCVKPTPNGRLILNDYRLKIIENGREISVILNESNYINALKTYFDIYLSPDTQFKCIKPSCDTSQKMVYGIGSLVVGICLLGLFCSRKIVTCVDDMRYFNAPHL